MANFVRLANTGGHQLLYHPATIEDFQRDSDIERRNRNLQRVTQYTKLDNPAPCPWNTSVTSANDACDNEILYALACDAAHALVTEDKGIHANALTRGLQSRVYSIQTAEDWLKRLHEPTAIHLPNIEDLPLHRIIPTLDQPFFDSLREGYGGFNDWFREKARENRRAWTYCDESKNLTALCIYTIQTNEKINEDGEILQGNSLKLCTFKVAEEARGKKIGELFLKASFKYATENRCEFIFIHANSIKHNFLIRLLEDFGFEAQGSYKGDQVLVKKHPINPPKNQDLEPLEYAKLYFPHFRSDSEIQKFIVPIKPAFHAILLPDFKAQQGQLFNNSSNIGNAIKLAYLCHAQTKSIQEGDILLFYRTEDEKVLTSIAVVDKFQVLADASKIASMVSRRTVYSQSEIEAMAEKETRVILFRLIRHLKHPIPYSNLQSQCHIQGPFQSIRKINDDQFKKILQSER
ncbi:GNAT family N-acetyltransferase [Polynucleobacter sp. MWH-Spelu-300-X4]|uniref:GNAT family N-acetyltransferase n=1 Tax=Polynucleobacter sp. MWH-Spelu-300-X4 TaxID=2689109 RepID=UPI00203CEAB6|nr:GNAT family N-acetyltransferase [Polynucleobacter sp. MWH-Spelu-300-X4]